MFGSSNPHLKDAIAVWPNELSNHAKQYHLNRVCISLSSTIYGRKFHAWSTRAKWPYSTFNCDHYLIEIIDAGVWTNVQTSNALRNIVRVRYAILSILFQSKFRLICYKPNQTLTNAPLNRFIFHCVQWSAVRIWYSSSTDGWGNRWLAWSHIHLQHAFDDELLLLSFAERTQQARRGCKWG